MTDADMAQLLAETRHRRERYDLYKAKMYGARPATVMRLRELERAWRGAQLRLRRAQADAKSGRDAASP